MKENGKMKTNNLFLLGMLVVMLTFGLVLAGCNKEIDITGTWKGDVQGYDLMVTITKIGWTSSIPDLNNTDTGTYERDGNTGRLTSDNNGQVIGTIEILDKKSISLTLNSNSVAPGTYTLLRQ
jgi:hypothetical protein